MRVEITFLSSSVPKVYMNVKDVYTKDSMLCLSFTNNDMIFKFPLCNVFSVVSNYKRVETAE